MVSIVTYGGSPDPHTQSKSSTILLIQGFSRNGELSSPGGRDESGVGLVVRSERLHQTSIPGHRARWRGGSPSDAVRAVGSGRYFFLFPKSALIPAAIISKIVSMMIVSAPLWGPPR